MSLSNILHPNNYDLYCNSINVTNPGEGNLVTASGIYRLQAANQTIPNNVETNVLYDGITTVGTLPVSYNATTGVFTVLQDCNISSTLQNAFTLNTGGSGIYFRVAFRKGAVNYAVIDLYASVSTGMISSAFNGRLNKDETFRIIAYQNTGSSNALSSVSTNSGNYTFFSAVFTFLSA